METNEGMEEKMINYNSLNALKVETCGGEFWPLFWIGELEEGAVNGMDGEDYVWSFCCGQ